MKNIMRSLASLTTLSASVILLSGCPPSASPACISCLQDAGSQIHQWNRERKANNCVDGDYQRKLNELAQDCRSKCDETCAAQQAAQLNSTQGSSGSKLAEAEMDLSNSLGEVLTADPGSDGSAASNGSCSLSNSIGDAALALDLSDAAIPVEALEARAQSGAACPKKLFKICNDMAGLAAFCRNLSAPLNVPPDVKQACHDRCRIDI